jgi:hypothetical protein
LEFFLLNQFLEWENSFSLGRRKIELKKFICSKRNKLEWEKCIESCGGELHT